MEFSQPPPDMGHPPPMGPPIGAPPHFNPHFRPHFNHHGGGGGGRQPFFRPYNNFHRHHHPMAQDDFDGKRLRKSVMRKTVDYSASIIKAIEVRSKFTF